MEAGGQAARGTRSQRPPATNPGHVVSCCWAAISLSKQREALRDPSDPSQLSSSMTCQPSKVYDAIRDKRASCVPNRYSFAGRRTWSSVNVLFTTGRGAGATGKGMALAPGGWQPRFLGDSAELK